MQSRTFIKRINHREGGEKKMKKSLILVLVMLMLLAVAAPVLADWAGSNGNATGDGEPPGWADAGADGSGQDQGPPGWSINNPGEGGTEPAQNQ